MKKYGILAYPAKHSLSPAMFNAAFKALGLESEYQTFEVPEDDLAEFMSGVRNNSIDGLSVSLPHKENILHYLDEIDEDAVKIGAVNTVLNEAEILHGYNTDFIGSNKALEEVVGDLKGKRVVVVGAGGASRAIVYGLLKKGAIVSVYNRNGDKAEKLAFEFGKMFEVKVDSGNLEDLLRMDGDILIQTSSVWTLNPDISSEESEKIFPSSFVVGFETVMDIAYRPLITPLLAIAKHLDKTVVTGEKMLLYQAIEQFKIWTNKKAPEEVMRAALEKLSV